MSKVSATTTAQGSLLSTGQDQAEAGPEQTLALAILRKDAHLAQQAISGVNLDKMYRGSPWCEHLVRSFSPDVAKVLDLAGMPMKRVVRLLSNAAYSDDAQAYSWILDHPQCKKFFSKVAYRSAGERIFIRHEPWAQDYRWIMRPSEYDLAMAHPFFLCGNSSATKVKLSIMGRSDYGPYAHAFIDAYHQIIKDLIKARDWNGVGFISSSLSAHLGPDASQEKMLECLKKLAMNDPASGILELEQELPLPVRDRIFPPGHLFSVEPPFSTMRWFDKSGATAVPVKVSTLAQVALVSGSSSSLKLLGDAQMLDFFKKRLSDPPVGQSILAMFAERLSARKMERMLKLLGDSFDSWRSPGGFNPAHVLMGCSPTVALAKVIHKTHPKWLVEKVGNMPIPLEMVGYGTVNEAKKAAQVRLRRDILAAGAKKVPPAPGVPRPTRPRIMM